MNIMVCTYTNLSGDGASCVEHNLGMGHSAVQHVTVLNMVGNCNSGIRVTEYIYTQEQGQWTLM